MAQFKVQLKIHKPSLTVFPSVENNLGRHNPEPMPMLGCYRDI